MGSEFSLEGKKLVEESLGCDEQHATQRSRIKREGFVQHVTRDGCKNTILSGELAVALGTNMELEENASRLHEGVETETSGGQCEVSIWDH
jgi:hypothetical protein